MIVTTHYCWLTFDATDGAFIAGRASVDIDGDLFEVSAYGQQAVTGIAGTDPRRLASQLLRELTMRSAGL